MAKSTKEKKEIRIPTLKLWWPKRGENVRPTISMTKVAASGILFTCILLSIASGFIDLTFFSGLSKSLFHVGTIPLPASILYVIISIGFILGKFWCATWLGTINELQTRLKNAGYSWWQNLNKPKLKWHFAHKFLVAISIITSLSLSVNSIGAGMRNIEQTIKNMSADANELVELNRSVIEGVKEKRSASKENISNKKEAKNSAKNDVDRYYDHLRSYQEEYLSLSDEEKEGEKGENIIKKIVREIPGATSKNAIYFSKADLQKSIQRVATLNESDNSVELYEEGIAYDKQQIDDKIKALAEKEYKDPDGTLIQFLDDGGNAINIQTAISRLQSSINKWQAPDAGDAGESSKIFTLVATYLNADATAGGMGVSEWMMLIFIAVAGIVQEFLIALFTPKSTIDRNTLYRFDNYFGPLDVDRFLISIYMDYLEKGVINQQDFEAKVRKCVAILEKNSSVDAVIDLYSSKRKTKKIMMNVATRSKPVSVEEKTPLIKEDNGSGRTYSDAVTKEIEEIEKLL